MVEETHLGWGQKDTRQKKGSGAEAGRGGAVGPGRRPGMPDTPEESRSGPVGKAPARRGAAELRAFSGCRGQGQALMGAPGRHLRHKPWARRRSVSMASQARAPVY